LSQSKIILDPILEGLQRGWKVTDAAKLEQDLSVTADVAIIGTGAGGGVTAEILTQAGFKVVMLEEGPLKSSSDFKMREADAYPQLYQESAGRKTKDKAINILQGRAVGGSTTVNWTSSFRTPPETLRHWQTQFGLNDYTEAAMAPWFAKMEERLSIHDWPVPPNENNALLMRGAQRLGVSAGTIRRNVRGCWNLGYCGMGCPTNAKQSMLVTTLPAALDGGASLITRVRAEKLSFEGDKVSALHGVALGADGIKPTGRSVTVKAKHYVLAGGAINSPALLLRSRAPDPHKRAGVRTFLHPVVLSSAIMPQVVAGHSGAPQTVYSDHWLGTQAIDGPIGFKLEAPPIHPLIFAVSTHGFGKDHADTMRDFNNAHVLLALLRDGFHDQSQGGAVGLRSDGSPVLDYPLNSFVMDGARRAFLAMAELQLAAGAKEVSPVHEAAGRYTTWAQAKAAIEALDVRPLLTRVVSAHVMGGLGMAADAKLGAVNGHGQHHQLANLSVFDGSVFPTSIGANPQLSIYGMVARNASRLAAALKA
jgi:choline dehydrogenase-like flavoprotein